jgi:hypothetical protein
MVDKKTTYAPIRVILELRTFRFQQFTVISFDGIVKNLFLPLIINPNQTYTHG